MALPPDLRMVMPTKKPFSATLPALNSANWAAFSAQTARTTSSMAPVSVTCTRPFSLTMASGSLPVSNISAKTVFAILPLMVLSAMRFTRAQSCSGLILMAERPPSSSFTLASSSVITQLASTLPFLQFLAAVSYHSLTSRSSVSTMASYSETPKSSMKRLRRASGSSGSVRRISSTNAGSVTRRTMSGSGKYL